MTQVMLARTMGMRMTRDQLCSEITKREGKKSVVSMPNVREVMRILIDLQVEFTLSEDSSVEDSPVFIILEEADKKLEKKRKKKPRLQK